MMELPSKITRAVVERFFLDVPFNDTFWNSLLHLIKKEEKIINVSVFSDLMDFLRAKHRTHPTSFTLKGRTLGSLIKLSNKWHRDMQLKKFGNQNLTWEGIDVPDWKWKNKDTKTEWSVIQLKSSKELYAEGRRMKHCVASYGHQCADGISGIFTMESNDGFNNNEKHLTIEVTKGKRLNQVRGRFNKAPSGEASFVLNKWRNINKILHEYGY